MVKFMIELYDTVEKAPIDYMEQFTNTKQGDETIPFYYASILKYGYLAFPESKEEERDGYMKNQFIKGLKNTELRNHIRMEDTSKMELVEVKDLARKYENSLMNTVQKAEFKPALVSNSKPDTTPNL